MSKWEDIDRGREEEPNERINVDLREEPLAFVRRITEDILESDPDEKRYRTDTIGSITVKKLMGPIWSIEFLFHERNIDNQFKFTPMGTMPEGGNTRQGSNLPDLGGNVGETARLIEEGFDILPFEFAELDAASLGHTHLTDYEFKYETAIGKSELEQGDLDSVIE